MPLAGSYLDKFALSSDPTHLKPFVRLRKLYYWTVLAFTGKQAGLYIINNLTTCKEL